MTAALLTSGRGRSWLLGAIEAARGGSLASARDGARHLDLDARAAGLVVCDLLAGGWQVAAAGSGLSFAAPVTAPSRDAERERVRRHMVAMRQAQLSTPAVRRFLSGMESPRLHRGRFTSIYSVMHDGRDLAQRLGARGPEALEPYLQVASPGDNCSESGLDLGDIWRYFRHTWLSPYRSTPGRGVMFLVRDGAWAGHPVIGLAMLGSAPSQVAARDRWIGWDPAEVVRECAARPAPGRIQWLAATLEQELDGVLLDDLLADGVVSPGDLRSASEQSVARLRAEARSRRREHLRYGDGPALRQTPEPSDMDGSDVAWGARARSPLFRAKRAEVLAQLIAARRVVAVALSSADRDEALRSLARTGDGQKAILVAARRSKASRMGVAMADLQICGAVSPFREILGGKLVAMMMTSDEAVRAYGARYADRPSLIASSMAGRAVVRDARIALITTAALFGGGSSQYNRLRGAAPAADYLEIGVTEGFGSMHLSDEAGDALAAAVTRSRGGAKRYSLFGEGVSPRLRLLREGLDRLGLPSQLILRHGVRRTIYAAPLARNARAYLCGLEGDLAARAGAPVVDIVAAWRERWLRGRIGRPGVLEAAARHTLERPVRHGARVERDDEDER